MAKITITLEDNGERVTLTVDGQGPTGTRARNVAATMLELAVLDSRLSQLPPHRWQPPNHTIH